MIGVLGEDKSDAEVIKRLIKKIAENERISVKTKGFGSKGGLLTKGARDISAWRNLGCKFFVVCIDADGPDPTSATSDLEKLVVAPTGLTTISCCVVPVQEIEAWILADVSAVQKVITSWRPTAILNPESINSPKEYLERLSKGSNKKPRYSHATHNEKVAEFLDIDVLEKACPSFRVLSTFVRAKKSAFN